MTESRKYVPVVITAPAESKDDLNALIAATGAEGATDQTMGAPVWDVAIPVILGADGWPDMAIMPPPDSYVMSGFIHQDALAQLPEDTASAPAEPEEP